MARKEAGEEQLDIGREAEAKQEELVHAGETAAPAPARDSNAAVSRVAHHFMGNIPPTAAASGRWGFPDPGKDAEPLEVEDGKYRLAGSDWIFVFEGGHPREAMLAVPPDFGGEDVKTIEP